MVSVINSRLPVMGLHLYSYWHDLFLLFCLNCSLTINCVWSDMLTCVRSQLYVTNSLLIYLFFVPFVLLPSSVLHIYCSSLFLSPSVFTLLLPTFSQYLLSLCISFSLTNTFSYSFGVMLTG